MCATLIAGMLSTTIFKWLKDGISKICNPEKAPFEQMKFLIGTLIDVNGHLFIDTLSHVARELRLKLVVISNEKNYVTNQSVMLSCCGVSFL